MRDISQSSFYLTATRLFSKQNKFTKGRSVIRREWRRVGEPEFWPRRSDFISGDVEAPNTCEFYLELERVAPLSLFVSELFKPFLLVVLGSLKYAVPIDEVADRASVDFVLLLIFYEASDVGLEGVFDLLDVYTSTCFVILFISTFETFAAHELEWTRDYIVLWTLSAVFLIFNIVYVIGIGMYRRFRHRQAKKEARHHRRRPKIEPLPKKLRIVPWAESGGFSVSVNGLGSSESPAAFTVDPLDEPASEEIHSRLPEPERQAHEGTLRVPEGEEEEEHLAGE